MSDPAAGGAEEPRLQAGEKRGRADATVTNGGSPWPLIAAGIAWLAFAILAAWRWHARAQDDFFITFRYAQNLAAGGGLVFNPGERAFGTTAPGYALLLGGASALTRIAPHWLGAAATAIALPLTALLIAWEEKRLRAEGILGGSLLVACTYVWLHQGSELPVVLALLAAAAVTAERRPLLAGVIAGAAVWCRPDAALGAAALGMLRWRDERRLPWRYGLAVAAVVALGVLAAWRWFGRPLPSTLAAKRVQAAWLPEQWPSGAAFWRAGYDSLRDHYGGRALWALLALGLVGQVPLLRRGGNGARMLALFGLALSAAYPLLGVPFYPWYAVPGLVAVLYGFAFAIGALLRRARPSGEKAGAAATSSGRASPDSLPALRAAAALAVAIGAALVIATPARRAWELATTTTTSARHAIYRAAGEWLGTHTPADSRFAAIEVGTLAYYSQRPVTDLLGLVSPEVLPRVRRGDLVGAFLRHPSPVIVESSYGQLPLHDQQWFRNRYVQAAAFDSPRGDAWLRIYRLRPGAALPGRRAAGQRSSRRTTAPRTVPQRAARLSPRSDSSSVPSEPTSTPGSPTGSSS